jgi:orotidine-5'-phosphate decarboxylase
MGMIVDKLLANIDAKGNPCVVGLDPTLEKIPKHLIDDNTFAAAGEAIRRFNYALIDAVQDLVPAVKLQMACYEKYGPEGLQAFKDTLAYARSKGLVVIEDGKRNDIGSTAEYYRDGHLGKVGLKDEWHPSLDVDWLTITPYLGSDGLDPFVEACKAYKKGVFILVKTSNPSSGQWQDRKIEITPEEALELERLGIPAEYGKTELYNLVGLYTHRYAKEHRGERGYSPIGAVVGATYPEQAKVLRKLMPYAFFLVPGYGAQGGAGKDIVNCFNLDGYGAVVNSSRNIIYAWEKLNMPQEFALAARNATKIMIGDVRQALKEAGKWPVAWGQGL